MQLWICHVIISWIPRHFWGSFLDLFRNLGNACSILLPRSPRTRSSKLHSNDVLLGSRLHDIHVDLEGPLKPGGRYTATWSGTASKGKTTTTTTTTTTTPTPTPTPPPPPPPAAAAAAAAATGNRQQATGNRQQATAQTIANWFPPKNATPWVPGSSDLLTSSPKTVYISLKCPMDI